MQLIPIPPVFGTQAELRADFNKWRACTEDRLPCLRPSPPWWGFVAAYDDRSILRWPQRGVCLLRRPPSYELALPRTRRWKLLAASTARLHGASDTDEGCSRTGSAGRARATSRAHSSSSRDWSASSAELRWYPLVRRPSTMRRRRTVPSAPGWRGCGATRRPSASVSSPDRQVLALVPPTRSRPADKRCGRSSSAVELVRYRSNDSVTVTYGERASPLRGTPSSAGVLYGDARHRRLRQRG